MDDNELALQAERIRKDELQKEDEEKREEQLKKDDLKKEDERQEDLERAADYERDIDMADDYQADDDLSQDPREQAREEPMTKAGREANNKAWEKTANTDNERGQLVQADVADKNLYDVHGNVVSSEQIDNIMASRKEMHASLKDQRDAADPTLKKRAQQQAAMDMADETRQEAQEDVAQEESQSVSDEVESTQLEAAEQAPRASRGDAVRARLAQIVSEESNTNQQERSQQQERTQKQERDKQSHR